MAYRADSASSNNPHPVVITGAGIVTSMGMGWQANAEGFRAGRTAFHPVTLFDVSKQRVGTAGQVDLPEVLDGVHAGRWRRMDRGARMALMAAREALEQAGIAGGEMPVAVGTSAVAMPIGEDYFRAALDAPQRSRAQWLRAETYQVQRQLIEMQRELRVAGPLRILSNACASGANAIGHGFHLVRSGKAERVLAGGYDALCQLVFAGFDSLQALSPSGIPRPFDAQRDGLALGEGAGFVVIETLESARARGAHILAHLTGYSAGTDVHHLTQPHPQGDAALATMTAACRMAGIAPAQVDYLNSHGTGTPLNDVAEGMAIQRWAGADVAGVKVSSTKSSIGHLLGGAGAVEAVVCLMAIDGQWLPASLNVREADPVCAFDLVREPREAAVNVVLTNSFGFGGANATLVMQKEVLP